MTLAEKVALMHGSRISRERECGECPYGPTNPKQYSNCFTGNVCGTDRLKIPTLRMNDGPQGMRMGKGMPDRHSTAWPSGITVAASFDRATASLWATAMGAEFYGLGANVQLGPGLCLARIPTGGRNFEYTSGEDPYLGAELAPPIVCGIQSQGVIANAKHYVDNNQETARFSVTEVVDERTQWELYYPPFQAAVEAGVLSVMCSYNKVQLANQTSGLWSCENPASLQRDLKQRMNFSGFVMSDYGGTHSLSINAGLDQEMPSFGYFNQTAINASIEAKQLSVQKLDDSARRILTAMFAVGMFDKENTNTPDNNVATPEHHALAAEIASNGTVLLKNQNSLLPINLPSDGSKMTIAVIGHEALGATVAGGGSGHVTPANLTSPLEGIRARAGIAAGANCSRDERVCVIFQDVQSPLDIDKAVQLAQSSTLSLVFVATSSAEGTDRYNLSLSNPCQSTPDGNCRNPYPDVDQDLLAKAVVHAAGASTAVVAVTPGALLVPWAAQAGAVLIPFMPGQAYGLSIASVLFGDRNPCARLPVTFPISEHQHSFNPAAYPGLTNGTTPIPVSCNFDCPPNGSAVYAERLQVGYRYFHVHNITPAFCFGHGLSYTTFEYQNLSLARTETGFKVSVEVKNAGIRQGAEVAQLYLTFPLASGEPPRQLKGIQKVVLSTGQTQVVVFELPTRAFSIWDVESHDWVVAKGRFSMHVGASSCDLRLHGKIDVTDETLIRH